jgi:uncharacterized protein YjhX (UPF0386 family)
MNIFPEKPLDLSEKIYYDYGSGGFSVTHQYSDKNGGIAQEHIYTLDSTLAVLMPSLIGVNTLDSKGELISSVGNYVYHPIYAKPASKLIVSKSENELYQYEITDASGNITLYMNETKDASGRVIKTECFTRGGRLATTEFTEYHNSGERKSVKAIKGDGTVLYECEYNEQGNVVSAKTVSCRAFTASYHENGKIKSFTEETDAGILVIYFNEEGQISEYGNFKPSYHENGVPKTSTKSNMRFKYDNQGYLIESELLGAPKQTTSYSYDAVGRIYHAVTRSEGQIVYEQQYAYAKDGSYTYTVTANRSKALEEKYDAQGKLIESAKYSAGKLSTTQKYTYDKYGNVTKIATMENGRQVAAVTTQYNIHGDIIETESSGRTSGMHYSYAYYDNGALKTEKNHIANTLTTYHTDGSKSVKSDYDLSVYDKNGLCIRHEAYNTSGKDPIVTIWEYSEDSMLLLYHVTQGEKTLQKKIYREDGKLLFTMDLGYGDVATETVYTYHKNGLLQSITVSVGGKLTASEEYDENGYPISTVATDENGKTHTVSYERTEKGTIATEYVENIVISRVEYNADFIPTRTEIYEQGELAYYVLTEYFRYISEEDNLPKIIATYGKDGVIRSYIEYGYWAMNISPGYCNKIIKYEIYENGILTDFTYTEYANIGLPLLVKERRGNVYTVTEYDKPEYNSNSTDIIKQTVYIGDKIQTVYTRVGAYEGSTVEFYGEDGKLTLKYYYYEYDRDHPEENENCIKYSYTYEYGEEGELLRENKFLGKPEEQKLIGGAEYNDGKVVYSYDEEGNAKKETRYSYNSAGLLSEKKEYSSGNLTGSTTYDYHKNGVVSCKTVYNANGAIQDQTFYDTNGEIIAS